MCNHDRQFKGGIDFKNKCRSDSAEPLLVCSWGLHQTTNKHARFDPDWSCPKHDVTLPISKEQVYSVSIFFWNLINSMFVRYSCTTKVQYQLRRILILLPCFVEGSLKSSKSRSRSFFFSLFVLFGLCNF